MLKAIIFILPFFISCMFYGNKMQSSVTLTSDVQYPANEGYVELYFEGVQPQYKYMQIGLITVDGAELSSDNEIIHKLKYEAWQNGADAVINLKKTETIRERGILFEKPEDVTKYNSTVFTGVIVKYTDSTYKIKYSDPTLPIAAVQRYTGSGLTNQLIYNKICCTAFPFPIKYQ